MTEYYHIVPWFNSGEWHQVYESLYSSTATVKSKQEALNSLLIWKARCPSLPSAVESTLTLLEVDAQDRKTSDDAVDEQLLRLGYSSAIMRFVNHMLDTETAKGTSLYQAAKNLDVPDWIIDLRHDTAHSNNLPSIEILREACAISLEWLRKYYWDQHESFIKDYISGQKETDSNEESKIASVMNFCISLSICASSQVKIKNLADIPDSDMTESIVNDARDIFGDQLDLSNMKTTSITSLINVLNVQSKKLLKSKDTSFHVNKALLGEDALILSLELLESVNGNDFYSENRLSKQYIQCFEVLLAYLHSNDLMLDFVLELIKISEYNNNSHRPKLAALWVSEIMKALIKSKQFIKKVDSIGPGDGRNKKRKELKTSYNHWFPNDKNCTLLLDLQKSVPQELTDINFIQPIISTYNSNLSFFIKDILNLIEPPLPKLAADKICTLAKLITSPESFPVVSTRIYTVDDYKANEAKTKANDNNDSDSDVIFEADEEPEEICDVSESGAESGVWKLACSELNWSTCPMGLLPWQQSDYDSSDMETE